MKRVWQILGVIALAFVAYIAAQSAWLFYETELKITDVAQKTSPDSQYVAVFQEVGTPVWPFGPASVRVTVKEASGRKIEVIRTTVQDDGARMKPLNWKVTWGEDEAVITLNGSEQEDAVYTVPLTGEENE